MRQPSFLIPDIREMLVPEKKQELMEALQEFHPVDVAEVVVGLSEEEQASFFRLLDKDKQIAVFEELDQEEQAALLTSLTKEHSKELLNAMSADDRVDLLQELPDEIAQRLLESLTESERKLTERLLKYRPKTAGAIMTPEFASVNAHMSVQQALQVLRETAPNKEMIYYVYVTDDHARLIGILSLKDLVLARPEQLIQEICSGYVISVTADQHQEEVTRVIEKYDFLALPVVDEQGKLLGIVTVDDVMDVVKRESTEDIHKMAAIIPHEEEYFKIPIQGLINRRIGWLIAFLLLELVTSGVLRSYRSQLESTVALAFFIPLLLGTGGNAGTQSATLIIRGLATGELGTAQLLRILFREGTVGFLMGGILGILAAIRAYLMVPNFFLSVTIGITLIAILVLATIAGSIFPIILRKLKFDPAVAAGPFIATMIDATALFIYFEIAKAILHI